MQQCLLLVLNVIPTYSNMKHCVQFSRYTEFGSASPHRPMEDLAFAVARFFVKGGSFVNYYMVGFAHDELD